MDQWPEYLYYYRLLGQTDKSVSGKLYVLRRWADYADSTLEGEITADDILKWLIGRDSWSDVSPDIYYRCIRAFWNRAASRDKLATPIWPRPLIWVTPAH